MKNILLTLRTACSVALIAAAIIFLHACNDDEDKPKTLPEVTTTAITDFTTTTAVGGGTIVSNGNAKITASGLVYSSTSTTPTLDDSFTEATATSGTFTSELTGLASGTPYYVRAYATNSVGTGYGDVVPFTTGNAAPTAINITITGTVQVLETLTAAYTYSDAEGDAQSGTTFQWYKADIAGGALTAIEGATELTYELKADDEFKFIVWGVTARAATGTTLGVEVKSAFIGPVAEEPSTVTFPYNGQSVTYGIIISPVTGRRWLDRNLGAPNTPSAYDDWQNYGDMFQRGRGADGHQLVVRTGPGLTESSGVNGSTTELSSTDNPGHGLYILPASTPFDWRSTQNNDLWQGVNGTNNPCPAGWRIPTSEEWVAENIPNVIDGYSQLKLTAGGTRNSSTGNFATTGRGCYWSSSIMEGSIGGIGFDFTTTTQSQLQALRSQGRQCRCIKD